MAANYRLALRRAFQASDIIEEKGVRTSRRPSLSTFPTEGDWKVLDLVYAIGVDVGYVKGLVHATVLLLAAMLAAVVWTSL